MTMIVPKTEKCAICSADVTCTSLVSTNVFGSPDLDLRPPEMKRSTMPYWVQECPKCGYVSKNVTDESNVTIEWLKSENYTTCDNINFRSELAIKFYKFYLISLEEKNTEDAFFALLHAAWTCDDAKDTEKAKRCRELAIPHASELLNSDSSGRDNLIVMKADIMRRSDHFDDMIKEYSSITFDEEILNQIIAFEIAKSKEKDNSCYRVENVTGK